REEQRLRGRSRQPPYPGVRSGSEIPQVFYERWCPVESLYHACTYPVSVQRRRKREDLQARFGWKPPGLGADQQRPRPGGLFDPRTPRGVRERHLQGRLLDVEGGKNDDQGRRTTAGRDPLPLRWGAFAIKRAPSFSPAAEPPYQERRQHAQCYERLSLG